MFSISESCLQLCQFSFSVVSSILSITSKPFEQLWFCTALQVATGHNSNFPTPCLWKVSATRAQRVLIWKSESSVLPLNSAQITFRCTMPLKNTTDIRTPLLLAIALTRWLLASAAAAVVWGLALRKLEQQGFPLKGAVEVVSGCLSRASLRKKDGQPLVAL